MRLKMITSIIWALLLSQAASRPQQTEPEPGTSQVTKQPDEDARSRLDPPNDRELKDYHQYMDQSLRTVATQLLNVSGSQKMGETKDERIQPKLGLLIRKADRTIPPAHDIVIDNKKNDMQLVKEVTADMSTGGRPTNSKYNYFEVSHPGQAMAMTEDDLERELSATRFTTGHKSQPTTTGGLSTWILLNPPSTTKKSPKESNEIEQTTPTKLPISSPPSTSSEKIETTLKTTPSIHKPPSSQKMTTKTEKTTSPSSAVTTSRSEARSTSPSPSSKLKPTKINQETTTIKTTTKKITSTNRSTFKPKSTTPRPTTIITKMTTTKVMKPNQTRPLKPAVIRKSTTARPEIKTSINSTSKIEKVTFKPVQMITTPKSHVESVPKPTFSAKIQASMKTNSKQTSSSASSIEPTAKADKNISKPNNVLKLHLKKPVDTPTTIEIDPIKVSAPVLTIEKLNDPEEPNENDEEMSSSEAVNLANSQIDVKFDFNPELTKLETSTATATTKRPKTSSKRKKHKTRRRNKPSSTTLSSSIIPPPTSSSSTVAEEANSPSAAPDTSIQESKIVPDSNTIKHKKKQVAKPITTQIYNFISREVMPSVGVMSLVGLGLGLASYFLYPFGGAIARRNYEIEPNYKYNLDEYGGNYGQSEEEVFTKVLQGMNTNDAKYGGIKNFENNYYRYQTYDGAYTDAHTTGRTEPRFPTSSVPVYRPAGNTPLPYDLKYRNTGYKYSDVPTTPTYYQRPKGSNFAQANVDRQFVVGNIPKEYSNNDKKRNSLISTTTQASETDFNKQIAQNLQFGQNQHSVNSNYNQPEAQSLKSETYEDIEITPAAVAVEHGPRSLKLEKLTVKKRMKRDSVIQLIPSRSEIEREEKEIEEEEPLSNEILDIIDSALPGDIMYTKDKKKRPREELTTSTTTEASKSTETNVDEHSTTPIQSTSSSTTSVIPESSSPGIKTDVEFVSTNTDTPGGSGFNVFTFVKKIAEVKFRLGLTILKHASESFTRYIGHVQKKINGDE